MKPQTRRVFDYIRSHGSITPKEAEERLGCMRLAARIAEIKEEGYPVKTEIVTAKNRHGDKIRFARYRHEQQS